MNVREIALQGAHVWKVNGLINDCGKIVGEGKEQMGWFDTSTLKEPYRIEGKKTMGLELAEQLGWQMPDVIFYPTGGGTGLIGMWKAFDELEALGWIGSERPRMVAVQATGCAPIVKAYDEGVEHAPLWTDAHTVASGIRVPIAVGDFPDPARRAQQWRLSPLPLMTMSLRPRAWKSPMATDCCSARKGAQPMPPTSRLWPTAAFPRTTGGAVQLRLGFEIPDARHRPHS